MRRMRWATPAVCHMATRKRPNSSASRACWLDARFRLDVCVHVQAAPNPGSSVMLALSPAFILPTTRQLTARQQTPCYCMAQPPVAASNETMVGKAQSLVVKELGRQGLRRSSSSSSSTTKLNDFSFRASWCSASFRTPSPSRTPCLQNAKESLHVPAGESAAFCCTYGAVRTESQLAHPVLADAKVEDVGQAAEAALALPALDSPEPALESPEPGAATRLPLIQATALALAHAEQRIRHGTDRGERRKCGPGSFGSLEGEAACVEDASDGSLRWVRA